MAVGPLIVPWAFFLILTFNYGKWEILIQDFDMAFPVLLLLLLQRKTQDQTQKQELFVVFPSVFLNCSGSVFSRRIDNLPTSSNNLTHKYNFYKLYNSQFSQFSPSFKQTQCSIINTFYTFNKGIGSTTGWQGISNLYTILTNINSNLSSMTTTIDSTFSGSSASFVFLFLFSVH